MDLENKKTILVFVDWFYPGYRAGGPVQSVVSLVNSLKHSYNFKIITSNSDLNSDETYKAVQSDVWMRSELGCDVYYATPENFGNEKLQALLGALEFDLVYINSFFSAKFSILPLRVLNRHYENKPIVLAPRGMLGEGALAIKAFKKRTFIFIARIVGLYNRVLWHATSFQEEEEIRKVMSPVHKIYCISNLPKNVGTLKKRIKQKGQLKLCFISRISIKKNLLFALKILAKLKGHDIQFSIYGPIEERAYWQECEREMDRLPEGIEAAYRGILTPNEVSAVLEQEELMFLPTFNENFGHAIVESLWCGCPLLISDQTPWSDVEENVCGFAFPLRDEDKFTQAITKFVEMDQIQFDQWSLNANTYIQKKLNIKAITNQYIQFFDECIKNGPLKV